MNKTRALVLGGGGAKGAYEVGVWQALTERNFLPDIVTGTSIGAINGALVAQGELNTAIELWEHLQALDVLDLPEEPTHDLVGTYTSIVKEAVVQGGADQAPLRKLLESVVDEEKIRRSGRQLGIVTVQVPSFKPVLATLEDIPQGKLVDYLLASSAFFPAMKAQMIDGTAHIDGGFYDNVPVEFAFDMGAREIVAVDLEAVGLVRVPPKEKKEQMTLHTIRSANSLGPILLFDAELASENIRLGYLDARKALGELDGTIFSFEKGTAYPAFEGMREKLHAAAVDLGFSFSEDDHSLTGMLHRRRYYRIVSKTWGRNPEDWQYALAVAELAGLVFSMDFQLVYTPESFHQELTQRMHRALHREKQGYESLDPSDLRTQDIARGVLAYMQEGGLPAADAALYTASPMDLSAAVYMLAHCRELCAELASA